MAGKRLLVVGLGNYTHPGTRHNAGFMAVHYLASLLHRNKSANGAEVPWKFQRQCEGWIYEWKSPAGNWPNNLSVYGFEKALKELKETLSRRDAAAEGNSATPQEMTTLHFFKPKTFMNFSGNSVRKAVTHLQVEPENIIILHDELDLPLGKVKWKRDIQHDNGHNGLKSVCASLEPMLRKVGGIPPLRLKIGIDKPPSGPTVIKSSKSEKYERSGRSQSVEKWVLGKFSPQAAEVMQQQVLPLVAMQVLREALDIKPLERVNFETMQQKINP